MVILERKHYHLRNIGALRECVDPMFAKSIVVSYDRSLSVGHIVQEEVKEVTPTEIRVNVLDSP